MTSFREESFHDFYSSSKCLFVKRGHVTLSDGGNGLPRQQRSLAAWALRVASIRGCPRFRGFLRAQAAGRIWDACAGARTGIEGTQLLGATPNGRLDNIPVEQEPKCRIDSWDSRGWMIALIGRSEQTSNNGRSGEGGTDFRGICQKKTCI